jgi:hypothetical protein
MVELYQALFDYLMAEDPSKLSDNTDTADFGAMFELFRKNRELPS